MATAREEAERLVAATLAAAQVASRAARRNSDRNAAARSTRDSGADLFEDLAGLANMASKFLGNSGLGAPLAPKQAQPTPEKHHVIANGSDECCICPVCRAIAAVRDPSPELAEKLASGASDLAAGVTSILRTLGEATRRAGAGLRDDRAEHRAVVEAQTAPAQPVVERIDGAAVDGEPVSEPEPESSPWPSWSDFGNVWQAATRVQDEPIADTGASVTRPKAAKNAVAKNDVAKKAVAKKAVAKKTVAKKAVAKKTAESANSSPGGTGLVGGAAPAKKTTAAKKAAPAKEVAAKKAAPATKAALAKKTTATKTAAAKKTAAKQTAAKKTAKKTTPGASEPKKAQ